MSRSQRSFSSPLIMMAAILGTTCLSASAQNAPFQVRPEFRTTPRPLITERVDRAQTQKTLGALNADLPLTKDLGEVDAMLPMEHIQLVLQRPTERQAAFDALVDALHTKGNPSYHQWLTPEQVGANFSPSEQDIAAITSYLQGEGFTVNHVAKSGMYIDFTGTAAQVEASFKTQVHNVQMPNGETKFAAVTDAQLPVALAPVVLGFVGLSNIPPHSNMVRQTPTIGSKDAPLPQGVVRPNDSQSCPGSSCSYYLGPQDFYAVYNETPLLTASTPTNGSGQTVALLEETTINPADVQTFRTMFGITATLNLTVDNGYPTATGTFCANPNNYNANANTRDEEGEAILDTEWAGAVAPNATLLFMNCASGSTAGIFLSGEAVIENNLASTMSMSYGNTEAGNSSLSTFMSNLWEQAAAQGQTVVISSGDSGAAGAADQNQSYAQHGLISNVLGSTNYNVSAGGTDFTDVANTYINSGTVYGPTAFWNTTNGTGLLSAKAGYIPEMPWNSGCASPEVAKALGFGSPNLACDSGNFLTTGGGSGGYSTLISRPSWQTNTVSGLPSTSTYSGRLMPDISMFASSGPWGHAMPLYQSDNGGVGYAGGTSYVAPQLAGMFALIVQKYGQRLGQPDYVLYNMGGVAYGTTSFTGGTTCSANGTTNNLGDTVSLPASTCIFHDVTAGTNSVPCLKTGLNCYYDNTSNYGILQTGATGTTLSAVAWQAGNGYDMATGLGSVNIANLVNSWQNSSLGGAPFAPTVAVTNNLASFTYGSPSTITYTATVTGTGSFPTGSATFSGNNGIGSIGSGVALVATGICAPSGTGSGACVESASQAYSPANTLAAGTYTITGTYSTTNESYAAGAGTTTLTVNQLAPSVTVSAASAGTSPTTLTAQVAYTGPAAPTGAISFQVDSGTVTAGSCSGSSSPLTCTASYVTSGLTGGTHIIHATIAALGNYSSATNTGSLTVQATPTFTWNPSSTTGYYHTAIGAGVLDAGSPSTSGTFSYTSTDSSNTTISVTSSTATLGTGTYTLTATFTPADTTNYSTATATKTFTVVNQQVFFGIGIGSYAYTDGGALVNGLALGGTGMAVDANGFMWSISSTGGSLAKFTDLGASSANYSPSGLSLAKVLTIDGNNITWVVNNAGTMQAVANNGTAVFGTALDPGQATSAPGGIAIDSAGSIWITTPGANQVTEMIGSAGPVSPTVTQVVNSTTGTKP